MKALILLGLGGVAVAGVVLASKSKKTGCEPVWLQDQAKINEWAKNMGIKVLFGNARGGLDVSAYNGPVLLVRTDDWLLYDSSSGGGWKNVSGLRNEYCQWRRYQG